MHSWTWDPHSSEQLDLAQSLSEEDPLSSLRGSIQGSDKGGSQANNEPGAWDPGCISSQILGRTRGPCLGVTVREEEAGAGVKKNIPVWTVTGELQGKPLGNPAAGTMNPESSIFIEDCLKYFQEKVSRENLLQLLTDNEAWNRFVAAAELPRDEADELRKALNKLARHMVMKDKNRHDKDQQHRQWFLKEFPRLKRELEDHIRMLRALAEEVQQVHRGTTIANVVFNSLGTTAGILTLLGLGLAPASGGASLMLTNTGLGLGTAAAAGGIASSAVELVENWRARTQACNLDQRDTDVTKMTKEFAFGNAPNALTLLNNAYEATRRIGRDIGAIRQARANSQLGAYTPPPQVIGRISAEGSEQVERVAEGPALAISQGNMILGASESAEEMKKRAQEMEGKLNFLTKIYEMLQPDQDQ
uniref:Apolipoprotein L2 n=1 Tax=Nomascus leucogenys TaxID=61853 RepID=M3ZAX6_NOMLE